MPPRKLDELADRCERVAEQIRKRVAGEKITDRLVSIADPDARPIRKGKLGKPNEFGYVTQIAEVTPNTKRGARGFILPPASAPGNPTEDTLFQDRRRTPTARHSPREVALDGGFNTGPTSAALAELEREPERVFISGRQQPGSRRTQRRNSATEPAPKAASATSNAATDAPQPPQRRRRPTTLDRLGTLTYNLDTYTRLT